jgi:hypothetical protein
MDHLMDKSFNASPIFVGIYQIWLLGRASHPGKKKIFSMPHFLNDILSNMETYGGNAVVSILKTYRFASKLLFTMNSKKYIHTAIAMEQREKRAVGRTRGLKDSRGRSRTSVETEEENLLEIVNDILISHAQQEFWDEEREERDDESMDDTDNHTTINATEPLPPPGNPIPKFTVQSWKAKSRRDLFADWRWAEKKEREWPSSLGSM